MSTTASGYPINLHGSSGFHKRVKATWPFMTHRWKSDGITSTILYWTKQSQAHPDSRDNGRNVKEFITMF